MDRNLGSRRRIAYAVLALVIGAFALPPVALATSGASGLPTSSGSTGSSKARKQTTSAGQPSTGTAVPQNGNVTVSSDGDGITLVSHASTMLRKQLSFTGDAGSNHAGETVELQRLGHQTDWQWANTAHATVASDGSFSATWPTNHIGRFSIRALPVGQSTGAYASSAMPSVTITVYRQSIATIYGPGFYGSRTACGQTLRPSTIGVANRTLRCGTNVAIYWHGRTMIVPVIDRGPYANHADWDLTNATAKAMGMDGTETIGAVSLPQQS
jgi:rare lipoprotein A (peptidoglycan hydrolase)